MPLFTLKLTMCFVFYAFITGAQKPEVFSTEQGAIHGYDPVAFFKENKAVKGKKELVYSWNGASWYFSDAENQQAFKLNPERYAPQYGGYCAYGTARGYKAPTQIDTWTIVNDKLYLNYNKDVQKIWNQDQKGMIIKADQNWPSVKKE